MTAANDSLEAARSLPQPLMAAQAAMLLPEVKEMLFRLSEFNLGIFMPHMHDEQTGDIKPLPEDVMQVESGLEVSFKPMKEIESQTDLYVPVGWCWRAGALTPVSVCEMVWDEGLGDAERHIKHTMLTGG